MNRPIRAAAQRVAQARSERRAARQALVDARRRRPHVRNPFTGRLILDNTRNRNTIFARRVQDLFLRQKFEITVKVYRAERPDDGPGRERSENGNVLCMSPQHVEVTRRQLRQLQKGACSSWTTVMHDILIQQFESGVPVEFTIADKERVLHVEPIDLRTSPAFGSGGQVDSEYLRFSTSCKFDLPLSTKG